MAFLVPNGRPEAVSARLAASTGVADPLAGPDLRDLPPLTWGSPLLPDYPSTDTLQFGAGDDGLLAMQHHTSGMFVPHT